MSYVDVGAYTGDTVIPLAKNFKTCVAIEPFPISARELTRNLKTAGITNCRVEECALGSSLGDGVLNLSEVNPEDNSLLARSDLRGGPRVRIETLDNIVGKWHLEEPLFIKLDVQGNEPLVLAGGSRTLARDCTVFVEFWPWGLKRCGFSPLSLVDIMKQHRYSLYK